MAPPRSSIVVRNLPRLTTVSDLKLFFDTRIKDADIKVFPLVQDTQKPANNFKCTTVTLKYAKKKKALALNGQEFVPREGGKSNIQIDDKLKGPITLAEHSSALFDLYFVHGLGGDAISSFACDDTGHMWPRDSFPDQCFSLGARGRVSTLGYDAEIFEYGKPKTIQIAAESILASIRQDRPPGCTRPIFFACHSLGGLVVVQALVLALTKPAVKPEYQFLIDQATHNTFVKGVTFFGTPFQGSRNADFLSPLAGVVAGITRMNSSFVDDMKTYSANLPDVTMHFNNIRTEEGIEILNFVEEKADGPSKVTTRKSATLPFSEITPVGVPAHHRDMVKFADGSEARLVITEMVNMIKWKLGLAVFPTPTGNGSAPALTTLPVPGMEEGDSASDENKGFSQLSRFDTIFVVDDTGSMQLPAKSSEESGPGVRTRWDDLTRSLQYIADIAIKYDKDGVDIHFLSSTMLNKTNVATGQEVLDLLQQVNLAEGTGGTFFEDALAPILGPYVGRYEIFYEQTMKRQTAIQVKPLNVIVLTDGKDDDEDATEGLIVEIAQQLDKMHASKSQVGIQFVQVGDDPEAKKFLKRLDDDLKAKHKLKRDIVDTKTFLAMDENQELKESLRKILLGAVNRSLD